MANSSDGNEDNDRLISIFGCDASEIDEYHDRIRKAAEVEYLEMISGRRVFTRGQDVLEYRLYLFIEHVFEGALPQEGQISALFQTTALQSRALLRSVMSKYQYLLQASIKTSLAAVLAASQPDPNGDGGRWVKTDSENVVEALNRLIGSSNGGLAKVSRVRGTVGTYEISKATFEALEGLVSQ